MNNYQKFKKLGGSAAITGFIALLLLTCKNKGTAALQETPTSGNIKIEADESFKPIVEAQLATFTTLYKYAHITPVYKAENELVADFLNDSVKVIVTSWAPTEEQKKTLLEAQTVVRTNVVAYDALALVLNKNNKDSLLIFDNTHSGNIRYFREKFKLPQQLASNFYAVNNNPEVVEYVSKSPGAVGILSVNWISDKEDSLSVSFTKKIKVAAVSLPYLDKELFYMPVQGSIYDKTYPFVREVNICSRESFTGLGSGFVSFVSGEKGQRIILKSGLVPATMPIRIIQVKNE
jgi:phosphate transport system substrate-binding protein